MLDPGSVIAVGKSALEFGNSLHDTLERAKGTRNVIEQILLYLQAAQGAGTGASTHIVRRQLLRLGQSRRSNGPFSSRSCVSYRRRF